jgi:hypothetical protein
MLLDYFFMGLDSAAGASRRALWGPVPFEPWGIECD